MNQISRIKDDLDDQRPTESKLPAISAGFFDAHSFQLMQRVAKGFASSTLVPQAYQGNTPEAIGNCMIALNLARRIGADPLMVMQNLVVVQGRPTWSAKFLIASVNTCGRFSALRFEFFGTKGKPDWGCRASAIEKSTGELLVGSDITWDIAVKEGWVGRKGSKWQTIAQQMFMYRAGAWWTNAYAPELSMGLMTTDEAQDVGPPQGYQEEPRALVTVPTDPQPTAQTIEARLDQFAQDDEPVDPAPVDDINQDQPTEPEAQPPHPEASDASAPSNALNPAGQDGADGIDTSDKIKDAVARGRGARRDDFPREVPKGYHYKNRADEAAAFLRGWDDENAKMNLDQFGAAE